MIKEYLRRLRVRRTYNKLLRAMEKKQHDIAEWRAALQRHAEAQGLPTPKDVCYSYLKQPGPWPEDELQEREVNA